MGQKNCTVKNQEELSQIIGNYRLTPDVEWLKIKSESNNHIHKEAFKDENSNTLDSLINPEKQVSLKCDNELHQNINICDQSFEEEMNQDETNNNSTSESCPDQLINSSTHQSNHSFNTTQYSCLEIVEETEVLATDSITESVDIRISPRNSTVELIKIQSEDSFSSDFSLVADVEIKIEPTEEEKTNESSKTTSEVDPCKDSVENEIKLINFDDSCSNAFSAKQTSSQKHQKGTSAKLLSCDLLEKEFKQASDTVSGLERANGPKLLTKAGKREKGQDETGSSFTVESKIAQEIKEMKQREEDLRKMRETLAKEMLSKPVSAPIVSKFIPSVEPTKPAKETAKIKNENTNILKTNNGQVYNIASVFGNKRKDNRNVPKMDKKPSAKPAYESPIEREIKIVKQREEELKREREQALKIKMQLESCQLNGDLSDDDKETVDTFASVSICSDSSFDSGTKLTTPDLKYSDGTLSPTSVNNNINSFYRNSSISESICSLDSYSQTEKSNSINGFQKIFNQNAAFKEFSINGNSIRSPSPDSSSGSSTSKQGFSFSGHKPNLNVHNKNVNMERFIASKGKEIVFKSSSPINTVGNSDYLEIKPPQVRKADQMSQRKFISAASKIQTELQEMKEREEELRKERARLLVLNGQTTNSTSNDTIIQNGNTPTDICTMPDFLEPAKEVSCDMERQEGSIQTRRKNTLIEEWERRIQKSGVQV